MTLFSKFSGLSLALVSTSLFAITPMPGWYVGVTGGVSYAPSQTLTFTELANSIQVTKQDSATIKYAVGGNVGGEIGYRWRKLRFEGELLFNGNKLSKITTSSPACTFNASSVSLTTCTIDGQTNTYNFYTSGQTINGIALFNVFYELYRDDSESNFFPYAGVGIGYASINSYLRLYDYNTGNRLSELTSTSSVPTVQGIIGGAYMLDNFSALSVDFRFLSSSAVKLNQTNQTGLQIKAGTINLTLNYSLDKTIS